MTLIRSTVDARKNFSPANSDCTSCQTNESVRVQQRAARRKDPYAILRNRDFSFFVIGRFVASFGHQMLAVAIGWEIYERTHEALALGLVGLTQFLPMVLMTLPAGHIADTRERKRIIMSMELVLTSASVGLAVVSLLRANVFWMYCCLFASGIARTFLWSATASFLPQLVSREEFPRAVMFTTGSFQIAAVTGPAAGGALIALTLRSGKTAAAL